IFARVGLQDGDILGAINGVGLTSPGRALAALQGARSQFVIGVERGDGALLLEIRLVDGLAWSQTLATQGAAAEAPPRPPIVDAAALVAAVDDDELAAVGGRQPPVAPSDPVPKASSGKGALPWLKKPSSPASTPKPAGGGGSSPAPAASLCSRADTCT